MPSPCFHCGTTVEHSPEDLAAYAKFQADPIGLCFTCDHKRRLCFRNGRRLYRRTCNFTGASIVSIYAPDKPYKVYGAESWHSDKWDAREYGREINWNRSFFEQMRELQLQVPRLALININPVNSDYCNMCEGNKNCYLIFGGDFNEDSMYGTFGMHNRSVVDCDTSNDNERCYWMSDSFNCYSCQFTFDSKNCSDCAFLSDCTGCRDCILCTGLVQKQYCMENAQLTKEDYEKRKAELLDGTYSTQQRNVVALDALRNRRTVRPTHMLNCEDCSGDYIVNSKNCHQCYDTWDCQDMGQIVLASHMKDGLRSDCIGGGSELCYNTQSTVNAYATRGSYSVFDSQNIEYCDFVLGSKDLFGCISMRRQQYCILNKQYSKEEYERLRARLVEHMKKTSEWDAFFPPSLSCFGYNESTAQDFWPLTREQALEQGFTWYDTLEEPLHASRLIPAQQLPDAINAIPDDILNWAIECEETKKPFRVIKQELEFYRTQGLPVPRLHPDVRHHQRFVMRTPKQLWDRTCATCSKTVRTVYAPDRPETVACEECYLKTIY